MEEARKRKGLSIRDVAEATKIRSDFLLAFEANSFDISLPEIYRRGFLRNYARFLKLDDKKMLTDYDAVVFGSKSTRPEPRTGEYLGRMTKPETGQAAATVYDNSAPPSSIPGDEDDEKPGMPGFDRSAFYKVGLIAGGSLLLILLLILLIGVIAGGDGDQADAATTETAEITAPAAAADTFSLKAIGDVTVRVTQKSDNSPLFVGTIYAGETVEIKHKGLVRIRFTEGNNLMILDKGREAPLGIAGIGTIDYK